MANIGFIGLGHMGLPMALNVLKAHHQVTAFDKDPHCLAQFVQLGGKRADSIPQLAQGQDVLITMLQTGDQVQSVCMGKEGLFAQAAPQTLYIDCSSIDVTMSRAVTTAAIHAGLRAVDAPVSGGTAGAKAGTLTFMVGGDEATFRDAAPILSVMGKQVIHAGHAGSGQIAKICNNMILGVSMIAVSEAFILAEQLGLTAAKLHEIVNAASGQCWVMSHYVPVPDVMPNAPANDAYRAGFTAAMMLKDLRLSQSAAKEAQVHTPLGALATELYEQFSQPAEKELDFSAIIRLIASLGETNHA
ncbi:MAG: 3-hydroxyisobutyrate dehydrogenase [Gammaproteobacteria bacterium]|nr:3-hydroxyisobutyrate dehydrogenase [Gammaproteobacteria bacterium]